MVHEVFEAIGTHWVLDIYDVLSENDKAELLEAIHNRIEEFDKNYSRFRDDSLVTKMSQKAGKYELPQDAKPLFDLYQKLYTLTAGKFTMLIGNTMEQAGYDAQYSLKAGELSALPALENALVVSYPHIEILQPVVLDVGAAGKGYLVDIVTGIIEARGIKSFCVDAGGDIVYRNSDNFPLDVGLENPLDTTQAIGVAKLVNQSLCASAGNRRKWEGFHHIINPDTLKSPDNVLATWVVADTGLIADGLATCLFFDAPGKFTKDFNFEYLIFYKDSSIQKSENFPAEIFYQ